MTQFKKIQPAQGGDPIYRDETNNKVIDAKELEEKFPAIKEELDLADPGTVIDSESVSKEDGDGVTDHNGDPIDDGKKDKKDGEKPETPAATRRQRQNVPKPQDDDEDTDEGEDAKAAAPAPEKVNPYTKPVPDSDPGFGFPRKGGKTVDIFDGETPHTHIRPVAGFAVPLSEENYRNKTDSEIYEKLQELELV